MTLLAVERIKLFTTRSPWWCALITLAVVIGFAAIFAGAAPSGEFTDVSNSQFGYVFGMTVIMVLAALSVTTEYRFGTIRTTFQAVPNRKAALLAKTGVVALLSLVIGEIAAFAAWGLASVMRPEDLMLNTTAEWISVAGVGVVFALASVIAVAVGILIRQSAGAISLLLIYVLAVENLIQLIPKIGKDIYDWMPFHVADRFLNGSGPAAADAPLSQGGSLAYFAGFALVMLVVSLVVADKRDA
ncbi:ABC transporter permease [Amycolatopsis azurea]|uniref:ABC transporter permease n=1 Tax=Amycolatopsis azurea DSM 43854 TaxID=1238180 RepID=M2Q8Q9_9PSEU|nr:ABC transporter permease [Amycolatopsis azurea]EMD22462.1 Putative ABC transport system membrane protein [Amycolatopsis azurea DSM 43854]OOC00908.1 ABC transporter permease [Amycolatopsis azurea DSM 43854]